MVGSQIQDIPSREHTETARLSLRCPILADVPVLFTFLVDRVDASLRDCRRRIAIHERKRRANGHAPWTFVLRTSGRIVGWGGRYDDPFDPDWGVEAGHLFHPDVWNRVMRLSLLWPPSTLRITF
jgi:[ribosomal protein S5]-alanine N-acetyltransferase